MNRPRSIHVTYSYLKNSIRSPSTLAFITFRKPPTLSNPTTITTISDKAVKKPCIASVHTTALSPPCTNVNTHYFMCSPWNDFAGKMFTYDGRIKYTHGAYDFGDQVNVKTCNCFIIRCIIICYYITDQHRWRDAHVHRANKYCVFQLYSP